MQPHHEPALSSAKDADSTDLPYTSAPPNVSEPLLLTSGQVLTLLGVSLDELKKLVATHQLVPVRLFSEVRFARFEVEAFVRRYHATAVARVKSNAN